MNKNTIVVNILGGPGTGKSTCAANLYAMMKTLGMSVELITEAAKDIVHENHLELFEQQVWISAEQNRRQWRVNGKYDYIITDSPILLALFYTPENYFPSFTPLVEEMFHSYNNVNFYLDRFAAYDPTGRYQTEAEADALAKKIREYLNDNHIEHVRLLADNVAQKVLNVLLHQPESD